jgi:DNA-directed RNA polymerase specialized sigma24 family protein
MLTPVHGGERPSQIVARWALLLEARRAAGPVAREDRVELLPRYGRAVYRYLRRHVGDRRDAVELCQEFAARFLRGDFRHADSRPGRFRDYLQAALHHLLRDFGRRQSAGGAAGALADDDARFRAIWRKELLDRTRAELARAPTAEGQLLADMLRLRTEHPHRTPAWFAGELSRRQDRPFTADAVRQLLHRARERFGELLRQEVAVSLGTADPDAVQAELTELGLLAHGQPPAGNAE